VRRFHRRQVLAGLGAAACMPSVLRADDYATLEWDDLLPEGQSPIPRAFLGLIDHEGAPLSSQQPASNGVRAEWSGQRVRMPGFVVPIDYSGTGVTAFILAPFAGACVHVPPPPANQLVFVTTETPFETKGLFEAVNVAGVFGISTISTHLAEVGYVMAADKVEPYKA